MALTLTELRNRARTLGLKGYTRMSREELLRQLAALRKHATKKTKKAAPKKSTRPSAVKSAGATRKPTSKAKPQLPRHRREHPSIFKPARQEPPADLFARTTYLSSEEERVEDAKYAMTPRGMALAKHSGVTDLNEDIEKLPALPESTLCLLPQRPGILHAYWSLEPSAQTRRANIKLRLCRIMHDTLMIVQEIALPADRGHWYFHVGMNAEVGDIYVQLGYYEHGDFITAIRRGIARIPSLYASHRTDRQWWIAEEKFRRMYLRAGGFVAGAQLGWSAGIGSSR